MSDDIPDYGIKITSVEIKQTPGDEFPEGTKMIDSWTEVENGETVTRQECKRKDGSHYLRTIASNGFLRSWRELPGDTDA